MSIVELKLAKYGLAWQTGPYHVTDVRTKKTILYGPYFDLTDNALKRLCQSLAQTGGYF